MFKRAAGNRGEARAEKFLNGHGLKTFRRNWQCRHGEIDLVMFDDATVVFVEVRMRTPLGYGGGLDSVDFRKQRKLVQAASYFLARNASLAERPCRFDVVAIEGENGEIEWVRGAFEAG